MSNQQLTEIEKKALSVKAYPTLVKMEDFLTSVALDEMCAKRLIGLFYMELSKREDLNNCTTNSICGAIMACAQYGLEPGIAGMVYIITNSGAGTITVGTTSSQTFANVAATPTTLTMATVGGRTVQSNGANWLLLSSL